MTIIINNNKYDVKTCITQKDISEGMMGKKFNDSFNGMLFIMNDKNHSFWMRNCIIPLDILFIKNRTIQTIHSNCNPCNDNFCESYKGYGDMVLEIPAGDCEKYNIKEGDVLDINF